MIDANLTCNSIKDRTGEHSLLSGKHHDEQRFEFYEWLRYVSMVID